MKLPRAQYRGVQSMGRADLGALDRAASTAASTGRVEQEALSALADIAHDYQMRKENAEYNDWITDQQVSMEEWHSVHDAKEFYTADELMSAGVTEDQVRLTDDNVDDSGNKISIARTSIPAYEVYPILLKKKLDGLRKIGAERISNPRLREAYLQKADVISSEKLSTAIVAAEKAQRIYMVEKGTDEARQSAIDGDFEGMRFKIDNLEISDQAKLEMTREFSAIYEWEQDTRTLNTLDIPTMKARLAELTSEEYGTREDDYLGPGRSSGPLNQEANIRRFRTAIGALEKGTQDSNVKRLEEHIAAIETGGEVGPNNLFYTATGQIDGSVISKLVSRPSTVERLQEELRIAVAKGGAVRQFDGTSMHDDDLLIRNAETEMRRVATEDPDNLNEAFGYVEALREARQRKEEQLLTDATGYLNRTDPAVQASSQALANGTVTFSEHLALLRSRQEDMGLTPQQVNFLTPDDVRQFKQTTLEASRTDGGATVFITQLEELERTFGPEYAAAYSQLLREGALEKEHIGVQLYPDPSDRLYAVTLINQKDEIFNNATFKQNRNEIQLDIEKKMQPYMEALVPGGSMPTAELGFSTRQQINAIRDAVLLQVAADVGTTGEYDENMIDAHISKIFDTNYAWEGEYRIPLNQDLDTERIARAVELIQYGRGYSFADDFEFYAMPSPTLTFEDQQAQLREVFGQNVRVVTNADETGVNFLWSNGNPVEQVVDGRRVPLEATWSQLERLPLANISGGRGRGRVQQSDRASQLVFGARE